MKIKSVKLLSALALTAAMTAVGAETPDQSAYTELIRKYTFDMQPYNLNSWQRTKSNIKFSHGGTEGRNNSKCLTIDCSKATTFSYGTYLNGVPCKENTKLCLSGWFKTSTDFPEKARVEFEMEFFDANKKEIKGNSKAVFSNKDMHNDQWQRMTVFADAPAGTASVRIYFAVRSANAGNVKFDDIVLSAMPEVPVAEVEKNYPVMLHEFTFDKQPLNWSSWQTPQGGAVFKHSVPEGRDNSKCLLIDASKAKARSNALYMRDFPCQPGKKFFLSAWVKASAEVPAYAAIGLNIQYFDSNKKLIKTKDTGCHLSDILCGNWQRMTYESTAPENAVRMRVMLRTWGAAPGKVLFDDVQLKTQP